MPTTGNRSATIASAASIKAVPIPRRRYAGSTLKSEISGMPSKYDDSHRTVTYPAKTSSTVATSTSRVPASCSARYRWYWLSGLSQPIAPNAAAITTGSPPFIGLIANVSPMRPPEVPGSLVRRADAGRPNYPGDLRQPAPGGAGCGFADFGDGAGVGDQAEVAGVDAGDGGVGPGGHEVLSGRGDDQVLGAEDVPGPDRRPSRRAGQAAAGAQGERALRRGELLGLAARQPGGEGLHEGVVLEIQVHVTGRRARVRDEVEDSRRVDGQGGVRPGEREDGFAFLRGERVDVHECLHVPVPGRRVGDDRAAVRMTDEHDRSGQRAEEVPDGRGVGGQIAQRVRWYANRVAVVDEPAGDLRPAGAVGPRAVNQDDGRFRASRVRRGRGCHGSEHGRQYGDHCGQDPQSAVMHGGTFRRAP